MEWAWITFQFPTSVSHLVLEELRDTVAGACSGVFGRMLAWVHLLNPTTLMRLNQRISWSSMWVAKHSSCQNLLSTWMHEQRKEVERAVATSGEYRIVSHYSNLACLGYKSSKICSHTVAAVLKNGTLRFYSMVPNNEMYKINFYKAVREWQTNHCWPEAKA